MLASKRHQNFHTKLKVYQTVEKKCQRPDQKSTKIYFNPIWTLAQGFAKYLKNTGTDLHQTLWRLRKLYRSSFKIKGLGIGHFCRHGNQLMGEYLAKNMIKEANFQKKFF